MGDGRGGGSKTDELQDQDFQGRDHRGGGILPVRPLPPSAFQVLPAAQSRSEASGAGETGRSELGAAIQALDEALRRRTASDGSPPSTRLVALVLSGSGGAAREG